MIRHYQGVDRTGLEAEIRTRWKGIVAMTLQGYGIEYNNRLPKNMYSVFFGSLKRKTITALKSVFLSFSFLNSAE